MAAPAVLPWSYSSLNAFETCPRRYKLTRIDKLVKEPPSEAMTHGNEVHKGLELHVKGEKPLADKYKSYLAIADKIKAAPGKKLIEWKFALTKGFQSTTFFAPDAWVRGVIDVGVVLPKSATIMDYKTGKPKFDGDQLKLFAGVAFAAFPYVEQVKTSYIWLAHKKMDSQVFNKEDIPSIWDEFTPRVTRMELALRDDNFPPKPSGLCQNWCPVGRKLCEFCGKN